MKAKIVDIHSGDSYYKDREKMIGKTITILTEPFKTYEDFVALKTEEYGFFFAVKISFGEYNNG